MRLAMWTKTLLLWGISKLKFGDRLWMNHISAISSRCPDMVVPIVRNGWWLGVPLWLRFPRIWVPPDGWFLLGKIPSFEMDDDWGYPHGLETPSHVNLFQAIPSNRPSLQFPMTLAEAGDKDLPTQHHISYMNARKHHSGWIARYHSPESN